MAGLSTKLLLLTILFVMVAEVLVFVPSVSNFRRQWLMERLHAAQIASLAAEAAPGGRLPAKLRDAIVLRFFRGMWIRRKRSTPTICAMPLGPN